MNAEFRFFVIVEGHGEQSAVPSLLHRIWGGGSPALVDVKPYRIARDKFLNNSQERELSIEMARRWTTDGRKWGVVILLDAEDECHKKSQDAENMRSARADIDRILADIPHVFALAEKGYESWLVAGFGGGSPGVPHKWLTEHHVKLRLSGPYKKTAHQKQLTAKFDMDLAAKNNDSFRRFRDRVLAMAERI